MLDALLDAARDAGVEVPKTGSDGHGYEMAKSLGHSVTTTFPGLVPLVIDEDHWIKQTSGSAAMVELSVLSSAGRVLRRERGSILFTHFGISGPVTLDISRHWIDARRSDPGTSLVANFLPGETFESLERMLVATRNPRATIGSIFRTRVPERVLAAIAPATPLARLSREERRTTIRRLTAMPIPVTRDRGFDYAEATAGGVPLSEVNVSTLQSRRSPKLFLCGEIFDVDGKIGGYNSSGPGPAAVWPEYRRPGRTSAIREWLRLKRLRNESRRGSCWRFCF